MTEDIRREPIAGIPEFSVRLKNVLQNKLGCRTVGDLLNLTEAQVVNCKGVGGKSCDELDAFLDAHGLILKRPGTLVPAPTQRDHPARILWLPSKLAEIAAGLQFIGRPQDAALLRILAERLQAAGIRTPEDLVVQTTETGEARIVSPWRAAEGDAP